LGEAVGIIVDQSIGAYAAREAAGARNRRGVNARTMGCGRGDETARGARPGRARGGRGQGAARPGGTRVVRPRRHAGGVARRRCWAYGQGRAARGAGARGQGGRGGAQPGEKKRE
jgi:hypothetical protein